MPLVRTLAVGLLASCLALPAASQLPSAAEFDAALQSARPALLAAGLSLRVNSAWLLPLQLRARAVLMAAYQPGACHVGYSPLTPGQDYGWLFPALPEAQRQDWLAGLLQHEAAHCLERGAGALSGAGTRRSEAFADLAFALHVDRVSATPDALIERLAELRAAHSQSDPEHDTAETLRCYLQHPLRHGDAGTSGADLAQTLARWRERCDRRPVDATAADRGEPRPRPAAAALPAEPPLPPAADGRG